MTELACNAVSLAVCKGVRNMSRLVSKPAHWWPPGLRIEVESGVWLRVDCGQVWTSVQTGDAERTLRKHGSEELPTLLGWSE